MSKKHNPADREEHDYKSGRNGFYAEFNPMCPDGHESKHRASMMPRYKVNGIDWYFEFTCPTCNKKFLYWHSLFKDIPEPRVVSLWVDQGYYEIESSGLILI